MINVVPGQGSETVRTEEAEYTALALIDIAEED
jgi:predicted SPOUT superfamily RNA methylase MTH1